MSGSHAVTHGHNDHVGALHALVEEYPDVQVGFPEAEAPYLTGESARPVLSSVIEYSQNSQQDNSCLAY